MQGCQANGNWKFRKPLSTTTRIITIGYGFNLRGLKTGGIFTVAKCLCGYESSMGKSLGETD